jgi:hypothetical protein
MRRLGDVLELIHSCHERVSTVRIAGRTQSKPWRLWWAGDDHVRFEHWRWWGIEEAMEIPIDLERGVALGDAWTERPPRPGPHGRSHASGVGGLVVGRRSRLPLRPPPAAGPRSRPGGRPVAGRTRRAGRSEAAHRLGGHVARRPRGALGPLERAPFRPAARPPRRRGPFGTSLSQICPIQCRTPC